MELPRRQTVDAGALRDQISIYASRLVETPWLKYSPTSSAVPGAAAVAPPHATRRTDEITSSDTLPGTEPSDWSGSGGVA